MSRREKRGKKQVPPPRSTEVRDAVSQNAPWHGYLDRAGRLRGQGGSDLGRSTPLSGLLDLFTRRAIIGALALQLLVVVSYSPAMLYGGFVWDDVILTDAKYLHTLSGLGQLWSGSALMPDLHYWPIPYTLFWFEHRLWGLDPTGYHVISVLIHCVNALLVWRVLVLLAVPGAWFVAALFAVHPMNVEAVALVIARKDLLSTLFYLSAVLGWLRFMERPSAPGYCLVLTLFVVAMLSKLMAITLPAALLILHWWKQGRIGMREIRLVTPLFAVAFGLAFAALSFYGSRVVIGFEYSIVERVLIAAQAGWFYVGKLLWPTGLAVNYPLWDIEIADPLAWAHVFAALLLPIALWLLRGWIGRGPLAGLLFFAVTLSPVLGFGNNIYMALSFVSDRYQYLAGVGLVAVLTAAIVRGVARARGAGSLSSLFAQIVRVLAVTLLAVCATLTWRQAWIYADEFTFYNHIIAVNPEGYQAHYILGMILLKERRLEEAVLAFQTALQRAPDYVQVHANAGLALMQLKRWEEAEKSLRQALRLDPDHNYRPTLQYLAELLRVRGRYEEAIQHYATLIRLDSSQAKAYAGMGDALLQMGRHAEAIKALRQAVALQPPGSPALHTFMGRAAQRLGLPGEAAQHFERALSIDASHIDALDRLAALHFEGKRYANALTLYQRILAAAPDDANAHANLGAVLIQLGRREQAGASFERALALDAELQNAASLHLFLGEQAQDSGHPEAALDQYRRALAVDAHNVTALDRLIVLYFGAERYVDALALCRRLVAIEPGNARAHSDLGAVLVKLGRSDEAILSLERALALDPDLEKARLNLHAAEAQRLLTPR